MKVMIVGAGKIGGAIAENLCLEGHDVAVIDTDTDLLTELSGRLDVICVEGTGLDMELLREAGGETTDMLIAATGSDERNLMCCLAARQLGIPCTAARIRENIYLNQPRLLREGVGLRLAVSPDRETAAEIARILEFPSAQRVETFLGGKAELVEYRIPEGSVLHGLPLSALSARFRASVLLCAVRRDGQIHIPKGNFVLQSGDDISLAGEKGQIRAFIRAVGDYRRAAKNVVITGGSRIAVDLTERLLRSGTAVTLLEKDPKRAEEVFDLVPKARVLCGDGTRPEVLLEEGLRECDAFVALTGFDESNIITSLYAKSQGVEKVIAKVNNEDLAAMLSGAGPDSVVTPGQITAAQIVGAARAVAGSGEGSVEALYRLAGRELEALEFTVPPGSACTGRPLKDLPIQSAYLIAALLRGSAAEIPSGGTVLREGDRVVVVTTIGGLHSLDGILEA